MLQPSRRRPLYVGPLFVVLLSACASVLGIEEPVPREDAGLDPDDEDAGRIGTDGSTATDGSPAVDGASATDSGSDSASTTDAADAGKDTGNDTSPPDTCTGLCVGAPPSGWVGPFAYSVTTGGTPQPTSPACAAPYATPVQDYTRDLDAPPASCDCTCGSPTGITCPSPEITLFTSGACDTTCAPTNQPIGSACTPFTMGTCPAKPRGSVSVSVATGGACTAQPSISVPPRSWGTAVRLCSTSATATGTCSSGAVCAPSPSLPQTTGALCIATTGDASCPPGYPERQVVYTDATDTRACSTCTCGAPAGATCSASTLTVYDGANCTGASRVLTSGGACATAGASAAVLSAPTPSGGACAKSGGLPVGASVPTNPTTVCCTK